jgi:hypothetical protein
MKFRVAEFLETLLFANRKATAALFAALSLLLLYFATQLKIDAGFTKQIPLSHPYMQTFTKHGAEFGGANRVMIAVAARDGKDLFTPQFLTAFKKVSDEVFFMPGVNRTTVRSLFTPNERFVEIVEGGFSGGNLVPADFDYSEAGAQLVKENVIKAGAVGRLVASDFSAAMISAQLVEIDPATGAKLDYLQVAKHLEERIRAPFENEQISIHIIGFAKAMGDIASGARGVLLFFGVSFLCTAVLVFFFTHSIALTVLPLLTSVIAVIWNLGGLTALGYGIDPMSILIPFLIFAIGVSHGVQMTNSVGTSVGNGISPLEASRSAFRKLLLPGSVALLSDAIGFVTLALIDIRMIRELAVTATLGVSALILTNLALLPVLLSFASFDESYRTRVKRSAEKRDRLWHAVSRFSQKSWAVPTILAALLISVWGYTRGQALTIGDSHAGVPELRPESRYNQDSNFITAHFSIGVDVLTTIVESEKDSCINHDRMDLIDRFQWRVANIEGVQSTISLPQVAKLLYAGFQEGNPKWRVLPQDSQTMVQAVGPIETATGLLNSDCSVMPVIAFLKDHAATTLTRVVSGIEAFSAEHSKEGMTFRLATGNAGVMAATNQVVEASQLPMLVYIYLIVGALCLAAFRSMRATLCIMIPLALVSLLCNALMATLGIGLKVSTLPVAALGVGIGVDYGIYIFGQMQSALREGKSLREAYFETLRVTGNAVLVTGLTLAVGVGTWVFSALQFQADMGILLSFMFVANMLGAVILLPALGAFILKPKSPPGANIEP